MKVDKKTLERYIGERFMYPNKSSKVFVVKQINQHNQHIYFECGHWCTVNVFIDLIWCKHNIQVYLLPPFNQQKLF